MPKYFGHVIQTEPKPLRATLYQTRRYGGHIKM